MNLAFNFISKLPNLSFYMTLKKDKCKRHSIHKKRQTLVRPLSGIKIKHSHTHTHVHTLPSLKTLLFHCFH